MKDVLAKFKSKPWTVVGVVFCVLVLCVGGLLINASKKPNIDKMLPLPVALKTQKSIPAGQVLPEQHKPLISTLTRAQCPLCFETAVPLCARCNVPLNPISEALFQCPICKQETPVFCPHDHASLINISGLPAMASLNDHLVTKTQHSDYFCPVCGNTKPPNWNASGTPVCPYCGNVMRVGR